MYNQKNISLKKIILLGLIGVGAIVLVAVGTVFTLRTIAPRAKTVVQSQPGKSIGEIMPAFQKEGAVPGLNKTLYTLSENTLNTSSINYKADERSYAISVPAKQSLLYSAIDPSKPDNTLKVQSETTALMTQLGLSQTTSIPDESLPNQKYTTYKHASVVCQLVDNVSQYAATHEFTCVDTAAINDEYARIEQYFAMYRKTGETLGDFSRVTSFTKNQANMSYTLLTVASGKRVVNSLLFAAVDKNESYIGDVTSGDSKYSNGKYVITPETMKALSDPKYNGFLLKNFTGQSSAPTN